MDNAFLEVNLRKLELLDKKLIELESLNKNLTKKAFGIDLREAYNQSEKNKKSFFCGKAKKEKA